MKKFTFPAIAFCLSALVTLTISSCQSDEGITTANETALEGRSNQHSFLYPPSAHPLGKSFEDWGMDYWKASYALNCEETLSPQLVDLTDKVTTFISTVGDDEVDITISRYTALFLPLATTLFAYPCPDGDYEPAPGQTLEEFLQEGATSIIDLVTVVELTFDGHEVDNLNDYRFLSDLFYFTGNPEQAECYDPCITGEPQPGAYDGYMVMFKKMAVGAHMITLHGEIPEYELTWDVTLNITVE